MWRQAGPWGRPLTTSETSTSTKDSSLSLQPALRGTVCHCGASLPLFTLNQPHPSQTPGPTTLPHPPSSFPQPQHPANPPRTVEKKKSLYFYKASYFYCMLSSWLVGWLYFCKTFTFFDSSWVSDLKCLSHLPFKHVEGSLEAVQPVMVFWSLLVVLVCSTLYSTVEFIRLVAGSATIVVFLNAWQ